MRGIYINQNIREYTELARARGKVLIEYSMPGGTSALKAIPEKDFDQVDTQGGWFYGWRYQSIAYSRIPQYWVDAMVEAGTEDDMEFWPQQANQTKIDAYQDRFKAQVEKARLKDA